MYDIIINLLGNLSFWYGTVLKDLFKYSFDCEFDYQLDNYNFEFYNYFVIGQIFSSLAWTAMLKYTTEKNVVLISLSAQAVIYFIKATNAESLGMIFFCRVLQGFFDVLNSVGKSFVFEFCDVDYIQFCFTFKGIVAILMGNLIPPIGAWLYEYYEQDYASCCYVMGVFSIIVAVTFYVFFYLLPYSDNTQLAQEKRKKLLEKEKVDEEAPKKQETNKIEKHETFASVMKYVLSIRTTRNLFVVYMISKALHKAMYTFKTVYYLKEVALGGLGFKSHDLNLWHKIAVVPATIILFAQPKVVPSMISYQNFIAICVGAFTFMLFIIPLFLHIYLKTQAEFIKSFMLFDYLCISLFTAKLFTPAMNILLNAHLDKPKRAALNSIFYFGSSFLTLIFNFLIPMVSEYYFDDLIEPMSEYNKFYMMLPFLFCQAICMFAILTAGIPKE